MDAPMVRVSDRAQSPPETSAAKGSWWPILLRVGVAIALVASLAWGFDLQSAGQSIAQASLLLFTVALAMTVVAQAITTIRWRGLVEAVGLHTSFSNLFQWYFHGMFFSLCLPTSIGGDVYKAVKLGKVTGKYTLATCTQIADRAIGLTALLMIGAAAITAQALDFGLLGMIGLTVAYSVVAGLGGFAALWMLPKVGKYLPGWSLISTKLEQLAPYKRQPLVLTFAYAISLMVQAINIGTVVVLGLALGLNVPIVAFLITVPAAMLLSALPLSIGGVGVREGSLALALAQYGVTHEQGLAIGVLWFLTVLISGLLGGVMYLFASADRTSETAGYASPMSDASPEPSAVSLKKAA